MGFNYEYGHWTDSWKVLEEFRRLQSRFDSVRTHEPRAEIKGDFMTLRRNIVSLSAIRSALSGLLEKSYDLMQSRKSGTYYKASPLAAVTVPRYQMRTKSMMHSASWFLPNPTFNPDSAKARSRLIPR